MSWVIRCRTTAILKSLPKPRGPVPSAQANLQAVRHQNLVYLFREAEEGTAESISTFLVATKHEAKQLASYYIDNPFKHIGRNVENASGRLRIWLDKQHIELVLSYFSTGILFLRAIHQVVAHRFMYLGI
jgi:hypothetical protein